MKIKIGNYDVISSGSIVSIENEPLDFIFEEFSNFIVRFNFIEDKNFPKKQSATADKFGINGIQFNFTNYINSLGIGNLEPLRIATVQNDTVAFYVNYRIYSLGQGGKHIHYSFLTQSK